MAADGYGFVIARPRRRPQATILRIEEADLLDKAADIIERGDRDPEIALQMAAWQAMVADSQYQSLVSLLGDASVALRPN